MKTDKQMTAACSGGVGDIIYSMPVMRKLGVTTYAIKVNYYPAPHLNLYNSLAGFLQYHGFKVVPTSGDYELHKFEPGLKYDINLDGFRHEKGRGLTHIMLTIAKHFEVELENPFTPWLKAFAPAIDAPDNLIHVTPRWRDGSRVNWALIRSKMKGSQAFVGFQNEWLEFCQRYGSIEWINTRDVFEMAQYIQGCKRLYCNQSCALTIAQGLGKEYWLENKPGKTNTIMQTLNEHLLNKI